MHVTASNDLAEIREIRWDNGCSRALCERSEGTPVFIPGHVEARVLSFHFAFYLLDLLPKRGSNLFRRVMLG